MSDNELTVEQACALLGCKRWTLYRYVRDMQFPKPLKKAGQRETVFDADAVNAWIASLPEDGKTARIANRVMQA